MQAVRDNSNGPDQHPPSLLWPHLSLESGALKFCGPDWQCLFTFMFGKELWGTTLMTRMSADCFSGLKPSKSPDVRLERSILFSSEWLPTLKADCTVSGSPCIKVEPGPKTEEEYSQSSSAIASAVKIEAARRECKMEVDDLHNEDDIKREMKAEEDMVDVKKEVKDEPLEDTVAVNQVTKRSLNFKIYEYKHNL